MISMKYVNLETMVPTNVLRGVPAPVEDKNPSDGDLLEYGYANLTFEDVPGNLPGREITVGEIVKTDSWYLQKWHVDDSKMFLEDYVRAKRNEALRVSDYFVVADYHHPEIIETDIDEWLAYREELRNFTETIDFDTITDIEQIVLPTSPDVVSDHGFHESPDEVMPEPVFD